MGISAYTFEGRLGKDPEWKQAGNSNFLAFSVAVDTGFGDNKNTHWIECAFFGKRAESVAQYLGKGVKVVVSGELAIKKWQSQDKSGYNFNVRVNDLSIDYNSGQGQQGNTVPGQGNNVSGQGYEPPPQQGYSPPPQGYGPPPQSPSQPHQQQANPWGQQPNSWQGPPQGQGSWNPPGSGGGQGGQQGFRPPAGNPNNLQSKGPWEDPGDEIPF